MNGKVEKLNKSLLKLFFILLAMGVLLLCSLSLQLCSYDNEAVNIKMATIDCYLHIYPNCCLNDSLLLWPSCHHSTQNQHVVYQHCI